MTEVAKINVIIVDDEPFSVETVMDRLEAEKIGIKLFTDPLLALDYLAENFEAIKVAIIDSFIPNTNSQYYFDDLNTPTKYAGFNLAKYIGVHYPEIKVAIFTVLDEQDLKQKCAEQNIAVISKITSSSLDYLFDFIYRSLKLPGRVIKLPTKLEEKKKNKFLLFIQAVWKDPVWSKVISVGVLAAIAAIWAIIFGHSPKAQKPTPKIPVTISSKKPGSK